MSERTPQIEGVKGVRDILPDEYDLRRRAWDVMRGVFDSFGYQGIELPGVETLDLHLRKAGEGIRSTMYTLRDRGQRDLCLPPEFTASVARMYIEKLEGQARPFKLYYLQSAFRYDRPQKGRYRQFTQAGVENLNAEGPQTDAEMIAIAMKSLDALGIADYEVVIGNIGIVLELLASKKMEERVRAFILQSLETMSKAPTREAGVAEIKGRLADIGVDLETGADDDRNPRDSGPAGIERILALPEDASEQLVALVIEEIFGKTTGGGRDAADIARNVLGKMQMRGQAAEVLDALDFIATLSGLSGKPDVALKEAEALVAGKGLDLEPLTELKDALGYLELFDVDWDKIKIDFGFGRGLQYYTGIIFEVYIYSDNLGAEQKQVCGGGRYDNLIADLGGSKTVPALGFSFGFERVLLCVPPERFPPGGLDVFIAAVGDDAEFRVGLKAAGTFRAAGLATDIGPEGATFRKASKLADRLGARFTAFIGSDEVAGGFVTLRDMVSGEQEKLSADEAAERVKAVRAQEKTSGEGSGNA